MSSEEKELTGKILGVLKQRYPTATDYSVGVEVVKVLENDSTAVGEVSLEEFDEIVSALEDGKSLHFPKEGVPQPGPVVEKPVEKVSEEVPAASKPSGSPTPGDGHRKALRNMRIRETRVQLSLVAVDFPVVADIVQTIAQKAMRIHALQTEKLREPTEGQKARVAKVEERLTVLKKKVHECEKILAGLSKEGRASRREKAFQEELKDLSKMVHEASPKLKEIGLDLNEYVPLLLEFKGPNKK